MSSQTELRIVVTPTHVDKVQLLAADDDGEIAGLELYQKIIHEVQRFTKRTNRILQGAPCVQTREDSYKLEKIRMGKNCLFTTVVTLRVKSEASLR